jgi:hypothetical protein
MSGPEGISEEESAMVTAQAQSYMRAMNRAAGVRSTDIPFEQTQ